MTNNDVLRRLRYALNLPDVRVVELYRLADYEITSGELAALFMRETDEGFEECPDSLVDLFLKGLIISRRGKRDGASDHPEAPKKRLSNNDILKAIRIALELRDEDIIAILAADGVTVSKSELGALFRKSDHPNFRPCGEQFLRHFLNGLNKRGGA